MKMNPDQKAIVDEAVKNYSGMADQLSAALGALTLGEYLGWRGLLIVHDRRTLKRHEEILGLTFKDVLPEKTEHTERLLGWRIADRLGKFWAVVKGEVRVPEGKGFMDDGQEDLFGGARGRST